jgi:hypothetical protein
VILPRSSFGLRAPMPSRTTETLYTTPTTTAPPGWLRGLRVRRRASAVPKSWLHLAIAFHIACSAVLAPVTSHPYDFAAITGPAQAWLSWGFSPFYNWKFGIDFTALAVLAQALAAFLSGLGLSGIVALHIGWKLPLVVADIATAGAIYRLSLRFAPDRATLLAALWLVNPVVLWVSAGHGQVESIAILSVFAGLELALAGRLFAAGLVTGLGVGIEYFPIAVLGAVIVLWRGGHLTGRRPLLAYGVGLSVSLTCCFAPLLVDAVGRTALVGGLVSSAGYSTRLPGFTAQPTQSLLAVWAWLAYRWSDGWPLVYGACGVACLASAWRLARRGPEIAPLFLSIVLLLAVLIDANALPQFAMVAAASLWLLALVFEVQPIVLIALPTVGIATYFLFLDQGQSTANAFFYDAWAVPGARLWPVLQSGRAAVFLGHLFSLGLIATAIYAAVRLRKHSLLSWTSAATVGSGLCLFLVVWASQPSVWFAALGNPPYANVPAFDSFLATRAGTMVPITTNSFHVSYPETLIDASRPARVRPSTGLRITTADLFSRTEIGKAQEARLWPNRSLVIPDWERVQPPIRSLWIELMLGSRKWTDTSPPRASDIALDVNGVRLQADTAFFINRPGPVGWALVDFRLPSDRIEPSGRLDLAPSPNTLVWDGFNAGPWIRVLPASGTILALVDGVPMTGTYELSPQGEGLASGLPLKTNYKLTVVPTTSPAFQFLGAIVTWPPTPELWKRNPWIQVLGAAFALTLVLGIAWSITWYVGRASDSSQPRRPAQAR